MVAVIVGLIDRIGRRVLALGVGFGGINGLMG